MSFEASELVSTRTRTLRACSALTVACAPAGKSLWQFDEQFRFQMCDPLANESHDVIAFLAGGDAFRIVGDNIAVCQHEIVAKLGALGSELAEVLVDRIGVVGRRDRLTRANPDGIEIGSIVGAVDDGRDRHG